MKQPQLLPLVREQVRELLAGYVRAPELDGGLDGYLVAPALGDRAGVLGSLELARCLV
jgi:fructokinase